MTNNPTLEALKACPFCGKPGLYVIEEDHHGGNFSLGCKPGFSGLTDDCLGANAFYTSELEGLAEAITRWNTRPAQLEKPVDIEAAERAIVSWAFAECQPTGAHFGFIDENSEALATACAIAFGLTPAKREDKANGL